MGILDFMKKPIKELYIARPPAAADELIWMHPDKTVPRGAKLTVRADEVAVFFLQGRCHGMLEAGPYTLDSGNIPFLGQMVVDPLTDGNHYLAELFFVRRAEYLQKSQVRELGTYHDLMSGHLVTLNYDIHFGVKVKDPVALITTLGGMEAGSSARVRDFLLGRLESHLRASVGSLMGQEAALRVVSNQFNEQIGQMVHELCADQFKNQGLELTRFVSLTISLDDESEEALREFGSARAGLAIQREGSQIANNPGFANFHLAQGQRSALEGLGEGMASGGNSAPILGVGIGLGTGGGISPMPGGGGMGNPGQPLLPTGGGTASSVAAGRGRSPSSMRWYLKSGRGTEGPYTIRQLVLRAIHEGETAETATIKGETDPDWFSAADEESVKKEFERRLRNRKRKPAETAKAPESSGESSAFETLFQVAVEDKLLTRDEIAMLAPLALAAGMGTDLASAEQVIIHRGRAYGCVIEEGQEAAPAEPTPPAGQAPPPPRGDAGPPPPPRAAVYSYDDGIQTEHNLSAQQVAERVRAQPEGKHMVWTQGLETWASVADVAEIQALIEA